MNGVDLILPTDEGERVALAVARHEMQKMRSSSSSLGCWGQTAASKRQSPRLGQSDLPFDMNRLQNAHPAASPWASASDARLLCDARFLDSA